MPNQTFKSAPAGPITNVDTQHVTFGLTDTHGRSVGYLITTSEIDLVSAPSHQCTHPQSPGHYFVLDTHYTVDREPYGGSATRKYFYTASSRRFAIDRVVEEARSRAYNKTQKGSEELNARRQSRHSKKTKSNLKSVDKAAKRRAKEEQAAAKIPALEAEVQALLDDHHLMEYLARHPWPLVIPGPPSMKLTAYDQIVTRGLRRIEIATTSRTYDDPKQQHLSELTTMLRLLKEQVLRLARNLPPDSPHDRRLLGYR